MDAPARPWSWAPLWLWLAAAFLLPAAVVTALPAVFEETPADRADALAALGPPVAALLAAAVLAAGAGRHLARRAAAAPLRHER